MAELLEQVEKFITVLEDEAENLVETYKQKQDCVLVDWKISRKETKESEYFIVTLKTRFLTLTEAKEKVV